ncbi:MAG: hypothetical protein LW645_04210 [Verrucomicrobiaceae bacterium]|nr:hypothetical protein [Verrucomicrobiaceae bacterium]
MLNGFSLNYVMHLECINDPNKMLYAFFKDALFIRMNRIDTALLDQALHLVSMRLEERGAEAETLVVCGGSALLALGLVSRTTKDVDALAGVDAVSGLVDPRPLSPALYQVVDEVGEELDLPRGWLNAGPADQVLMGLPEGFLSQLIRHEYGARLTIFYPDRFDLIHLKLFACIDQGEGRHSRDLKALAPTQAEMPSAARWVCTQDGSEVFPALVREAVTQLGYPHVTEQF